MSRAAGRRHKTRLRYETRVRHANRCMAAIIDGPFTHRQRVNTARGTRGWRTFGLRLLFGEGRWRPHRGTWRIA